MELLIRSLLSLCGFNTPVGGKEFIYSSALSLRFCSAVITHQHIQKVLRLCQQ